MPLKTGGKRADEMRADHQEFLDRQPTTTRCSFCPWKYEGPAAEGRLEAERHRRDAHPERAQGGKLAAAFDARRRRRSPWTKAELGEAFARFEREHGREATDADIPLCPYLPSYTSALKVAGSWPKAVALGRAPVSAPLAPEPAGTQDEPPEAPVAPQRPAGRDPGTVPADPLARLRAALHELVDAALDLLVVSSPT
jgi:hypothetical protein